MNTQPTVAVLENDIQSVWGQAAATLPLASPDTKQVVELVAALRDCAERSKAIGFASGERELLRMARFLEGRITPSDYPRYGTDVLMTGQ